MPAPYRLRGQRFLLTYPQCPHDAAEALSAKCAAMGSQRYLVCKELHQDGGQHLHAYVEFPAQQTYLSPTAWDFAGHHGNYQPARSANRAAGYVAKDGDLIAIGFTPAELETLKKRSREPITKILGKRLMEGTAVEALFQEYPELNITRDINKIKSNINQVRGYDPALKDRVLEEIQIFNLTWKFNPKAKCRGEGGNFHPCIIGEPNIGKSTIIDKLRDLGWRVYNYRHTQGQNANWVDFNPNNYDAIMLDDADHDMLKTIGYSNLNAIMDGRRTWLNVKCVGSIEYFKPMPIIIISNWSREWLFPGRDAATEALVSRLAIFNVTNDKRAKGGRYDPDFPPTAVLTMPQ